MSPYVWNPYMYYGYTPFAAVYNPVLGYTVMDPSYWSPSVAQLLEPSLSPEV